MREMDKLSLDSLLLVWRDKKTSLYFHVGTLTHDGAKYIFEYTYQSKATRTVHEAIQHGYRLHPAFADLTNKYESTDLFPAFDRRVPSDDRVDYYKILKDLELPTNASRMDILRKTRGMIAGDSYFFEEPLRLNRENQLSTHFYISGMRYRDLPSNWKDFVQPGDQIYPVIDKDNEHDPYAIRLYNAEKLWLGYVPGIYSQAIQALIKRGVEIKITVEEIRPHHAPQWWLRVSLEAALDSDDDKPLDTIEFGELVFYAA